MVPFTRGLKKAIKVCETQSEHTLSGLVQMPSALSLGIDLASDEVYKVLQSSVRGWVKEEGTKKIPTPFFNSVLAKRSEGIPARDDLEKMHNLAVVLWYALGDLTWVSLESKFDAAFMNSTLLEFPFGFPKLGRDGELSEPMTAFLNQYGFETKVLAFNQKALTKKVDDNAQATAAEFAKQGAALENLTTQVGDLTARVRDQEQHAKSQDQRMDQFEQFQKHAIKEMAELEEKSNDLFKDASVSIKEYCNLHELVVALEEKHDRFINAEYTAFKETCQEETALLQNKVTIVSGIVKYSASWINYLRGRDEVLTEGVEQAKRVGEVAKEKARLAKKGAYASINNESKRITGIAERITGIKEEISKHIMSTESLAIEFVALRAASQETRDVLDFNEWASIHYAARTNQLVQCSARTASDSRASDSQASDSPFPCLATGSHARLRASPPLASFSLLHHSLWLVPLA